MALIPEQDWDRYFKPPMRQLSIEEVRPFDLREYIAGIPKEDFDGYDCSGEQVEYVYRDGSERFEHVLLSASQRDVFMVIVLDRMTQAVAGHKLLDLPGLYGLRD